MEKNVITEIPNRQAFMHLLNNNPGLIVIKLGAEWCGPCKTIKHVVNAFFASSPETVVCCDIDVDISFDFYSLLKSKMLILRIYFWRVICNSNIQMFTTSDKKVV